MIRFLKKIASNKFVPVGWTIFTIVLLCIPGKAIPGLGLFSVKHLDKIVHVFLFGVFVLLWSFHFAAVNTYKNLFVALIGIVTVSILIGVALEFVQEGYIPNRSFDTGDIVADIVGSALAAAYIFLEIRKSGKKTTHLI